MPDFIRNKTTRYNDIFQITIHYTQYQYETKIELIEQHSNRIYTFEHGNFLHIDLFGCINFHKDVPYVGFQIFNDYNKHLGVGTIIFDTFFDFINEYNSNKNIKDKIHYAIGSLSSATKSTWQEALSFYLNYTYPNITTNLYSDSMEVYSVEEFITQNKDGKIIFNVIHQN